MNNRGAVELFRRLRKLSRGLERYRKGSKAIERARKVSKGFKGLSNHVTSRGNERKAIFHALLSHRGQAARRLHGRAKGVNGVGVEPGNALRGDVLLQYFCSGLELSLIRAIDDVAPGVRK